ncbi:DUF4330 family protein [Candidatus Cryosericum terrychapinii]|uniref:DUF4330 family protein n=1 Tax=Candidatus Cryosericum terrychapinii TaxID=2290919 RepID=A0A398D526_9BACT|nr:DUF4330 family protein [Candidatus Cryosericum terrychapinii]RIE06204.1 DUF4330 family protein [Candidatus Cryosericum terrychapinii]
MRNKWIVGLVLALVVVAGVVAAYKLTHPSTGAKGLSGKRIEATFLAYGIEPETAAEIKTGAPIYDETGKKCFTITNITTSPAEVDAFDSKGELHVDKHPILKDVVITAQSVDAKVAWAYMYARDKILAGANVAVYGDTWKVWTRILTVQDLP